MKPERSITSDAPCSLRDGKALPGVRRTCLAAALASVGTASSFLVPPARGADGSWLGNSGNWSDPAIWSGGTVADGTDFTAFFTGIDITANQTLTIDTARTIGNIVFTDATTASHNLTIGGTNPLLLDVSGGSPVIDVTQSGRTLTINSEIQGSDGFTKSGAGMLTLGGANSHSGATVIGKGTLALANIGALASTSAITIAGSTLRTNVADVVLGAPVTLDGGTATITAPALGSSGGTVYNLTLNGAISGTGNLTLLGVQGSNVYGTIILGGASTYDGSTLFTTDTNNSNKNIFVKLGVDNALPATTVLTLDGQNGTGSGRYTQLDLNGHSQALAGLTNPARTLRAQRVYNTSATAATLTIEGSGNHTFSGALGAGSGNDNFGLTKSGAGKFTVSGNNAYTGATTINAGTLAGVTGGACGASAVTVATAAATLGVTISDSTKVWSCSSVAFAAAGTLEFDFGSVSPSDSLAPLAVTNAVDFTATPAVIVRGASLANLAVGSYPLMTWGSVSGSVPSGVILPPTMAGNLSVTGNTLYLNVTTASALPLYWGTGDGTWDIGASPSWKNSAGVLGTYQENLAGTPPVVFDDIDSGPGPDISVSLAVAVAPASVLFDNSTKNFTLSGGGVVTGSTGVSKTGTGRVVLANANSYSGATIVTAGTLGLAGNRTIAPTVTPGHDIGGTDAVLEISGDLNLGATQLRVGNATGPGTIRQTAGAVTFSGGNQLTVGTNSIGKGTYHLSGGTFTTAAQANRGVILGVNAGCIGTFNLSGTGALNLVGGSSLQVGRCENVAATGSTGIFNQTGGTATIGELRIGGSAAANNANETATLNLSGGTFAAAAFTALSGGDGSVSTINLGGTADVTLPAFPSTRGAGATATINFDGGILRPAAASTAYIGGLTNAFIKAGGAAIDVAAGNDIAITQDLLADPVSAGGGLAKSGAGTLTLSGNNTYSGATSVNAGTLALAGGSQASPVTVKAGASLGFTLDSPTVSAAAVTFEAGSTVKVTGMAGLRSYTLMTAASFAGVAPALDSPIAGYSLVVDGGTALKLVQAAGGYAAWAATNAPGGTPAGDFDGDGVANGVEYVLGGNKDTNDLAKLPQLSTAGGNMLFSFVRDQASIDGGTAVAIEVGTGLTAWPDVYPVPDGAAASDPGVSVIKDSPSGFDTVTLTLPRSPDARKFARLRVTPN